MPGPFESILQGLNSDKQGVVRAVKGLLRPSRGGRNKFLEANTISDERD
jgi:hypothetical protein